MMPDGPDSEKRKRVPIQISRTTKPILPNIVKGFLPILLRTSIEQKVPSNTMQFSIKETSYAIEGNILATMMCAEVTTELIPVICCINGSSKPNR